MVLSSDFEPWYSRHSFLKLRMIRANLHTCVKTEGKRSIPDLVHGQEKERGELLWAGKTNAHQLDENPYNEELCPSLV